MLAPEAKLFKDIVQTRSFSQAAALNGISQSAASQHVREVERRLGLPLFDRHTRPPKLTEAGKLYYDFCRDVARREEQFTHDLARLKADVDGQVRVACIYSIGLSEMSHLKVDFSARYPEAALRVDYMRPEKIYEAVLTETADLGVVSYPEATKELSVIHWREERMTVAAAPSHPLASRPVLYPEDLNGQNFVGFDEDLKIRKEIDRFFRDQGLSLQLTMHFDNIQMIKEAVELGTDISILPARTMQTEIEQGRLVSIPLHAPGLVRPVGIVHLRRKKFNRAATAFLELVGVGVAA